jgi:lysophospholipase L1-like esterase
VKTGKRIIRQVLIWLLVLGIVVSTGLDAGICQAAGKKKKAAQEKSVEKEPEVEYVALGDSIPNGYVAPGENEVVSYPYLLEEEIAEIGSCQVDLETYTKNGLTTSGLYEKFLSDPEVEEKIEEADVITITIGSNDLLQEFRSVSQEVLNMEERPKDMPEALEALQTGIEENPMLLLSIAKAIGTWDYDSFASRWENVMGIIQNERKDDAQVVVTTIYNPVAKKELPGTLNTVVESVIGKMNDIMFDYADQYDYQVADLFSLGVESYTQADGLHPNQEGNELIKGAIENQLDFNVFIQMTQEAQKAIQEQKIKLEQVQKAKARKIRMRRIKEGVCVGIIVVFILFLIFHIRKKKKKKQKTADYAKKQDDFANPVFRN